MIEIQSWAEIPQDKYDAAYALLSQMLREGHPELDQKRGAIHDVALGPAAALTSAARVETARLVASGSIKGLTETVVGVDDDIAQALFADYGISPRLGTVATGVISVVISRLVPVVIPAGFRLSSGTLVFETTASFTGRPLAADVQSTADRPITDQGDGTWAFEIDVQALEVGSAYLVRQGTTLLPEKAVTHVVTYRASRDFQDGRNADTVETMLAQFQTGIAAKTWSHPSNVLALVRAQEGFESVEISVVGAGSPAQLRDKHGVFEFAAGNRVDLWFKSPTPPTLQSFELDALYLGFVGGSPRWRVVVPRTALPGFYAIEYVYRSSRSSTLTASNLSATAGFDREAGDPDIVNALEAAFSAFSTTTIEFNDAPEPGEALTPNVSTVKYTLTGMVCSGIADLQSALTSDTLAPVAGDLVVRGAAPCFVAVSVDVTSLSGVPQGEIAIACSDYVQGLGFNGRVYASRLQQIVADRLPFGVELVRIQLSGVIYRPDGDRQAIRGVDRLSAPYEPDAMLTDATVGFYLSPGNVAFNVVNP